MKLLQSSGGAVPQSDRVVSRVRSDDLQREVVEVIFMYDVSAMFKCLLSCSLLPLSPFAGVYQ